MSRAAFGLAVALVVASLSGCGGGPAAKKEDKFFTSGSREADQRASQRMARAEQLAGSGEGTGEKGAKKSKPAEPGKPAQAAEVEAKKTLHERLGGNEGIAAIVDDFVPRALNDPRVNWERKGIKTGNFLFKRDRQPWAPNPQNLALLKKHMAQFLALATGGPARYEGKEMVQAHADMQITNPEFDAAVGDLKASLDKLRIPNQEQKELLAIIESTRPQVVTKR